jgi:antitoxin (DNA-binding transcriptional repressor) of toxin-antitoxin stability system
MEVMRITEAELARDVHAVIEKVRQGAEVVIEHDHRPVAVIKTPQFRGRDIEECIAIAKAQGSHAIPDEDFAKDVQAAIDAHRDPLDPPSWD